MASINGRGLTNAQKSELWRRWKEGQSLSEIGRALGKHAASIRGVLAIRGGIAPPNASGLFVASPWPNVKKCLVGSQREILFVGLHEP